MHNHTVTGFFTQVGSLTRFRANALSLTYDLRGYREPFAQADPGLTVLVVGIVVVLLLVAGTIVFLRVSGLWNDVCPRAFSSGDKLKTH